MSQCGRDFLIAAIDPMHDTQLQNLAGWPDLECAGSVRRCIKQSMNVTKPSAVTTSTWDCHVVAWPFLMNYDHHSYSLANSVILNNANAGPNTSSGGLIAYGVDAGAPLNVFNTFAGSAVQIANQLRIDSAFTKGVGRLVGAGFEVINTTSDLYRQGTCTVYRSPQLKQSEFTAFIHLGGDFEGYSSYEQVRPPPVSMEQAMLYPGTRQWKAEEGCYCVYPFCGNENPPKGQSFTNPIVFPDRTGAIGETSDALAPAINSVVGGGVQVLPIKIEDVHMPGAMFTGLSAETTLTVNWNVYYESFPTADEQDILVMATPSCHYDPVALEFFSRALSNLPVGVPASDNPSGEFFSDFVQGIADWAPAIGKAMGGPFDLLGRGIGGAASYVHDNYLAPPTPQSRPSSGEKKKKSAKRSLTNDELSQIISKAVAAQRANRPPQKAIKGKGKNKKKQNNKRA
jgi:hypothetical protein